MGGCKRCARLTKALVLASESLRFQGSRQCGIDTCGEQTEHALQPDGAQDSTISPSVSGTGSLRKTTRLQGLQALLFAPKPTLHESRHVLGETLHISILAAHDA